MGLQVNCLTLHFHFRPANFLSQVHATLITTTIAPTFDHFQVSFPTPLPVRVIVQLHNLWSHEEQRTGTWESQRLEQMNMPPKMIPRIHTVHIVPQTHPRIFAPTILTQTAITTLLPPNSRGALVDIPFTSQAPGMIGVRKLLCRGSLQITSLLSLPFQSVPSSTNLSLMAIGSKFSLLFALFSITRKRMIFLLCHNNLFGRSLCCRHVLSLRYDCSSPKLQSLLSFTEGTTRIASTRAQRSD